MSVPIYDIVLREERNGDLIYHITRCPYERSGKNKMSGIICFHNPDEDYGWLSNWAFSSFAVDGVRFALMEQYMMYRKALLFGDAENARRILAEEDAGAVKRLGREVRGYNETVWNGCRQIVVYRGLLAKFTQNAELGALLRKTGAAVLAECAVHDRIWGIGLSMRDPARLCMDKWRGQNLLGFALMQVRERISEQTERA